jgi:hypothetical protein
MANILQKIKREFLQVLPPTIFFLFAFYSVLVELVRALGKERVVKMFFG